MEEDIGNLVVLSTQPKKGRKTDGSYVVLIHMPFLGQGLQADFARWFSITIHADAVDGDEGLFSEVWIGDTPQHSSSFAVLGTDLYCVGGRRFQGASVISDVCKINIRDPSSGWTPVLPMKIPRSHPHTLVVGGKLYVLSGYPFAQGQGGESFNPVTGSWDCLPDPPCHMKGDILSAALENPNRILVASVAEHNGSWDTFANFFIFDVQNFSWKMLEPAHREIHRDCPLGMRGKAVAVRNYLYWITNELLLLAYDLELDLWLQGHLEGLNTMFLPFEKRHLPGLNHPRIPGLIHLEGQRFCIIQRTLPHRPVSERRTRCVLFDVSPMPERNYLGISFVSTIEYDVRNSAAIADCLLLRDT